MSSVGLKLRSVVGQSCPRCHHGELFVNKNPYKMENWDKMHSECSHCGLHYEIEPGFFQGAMYVSYALGVALSIGVVIINILIGFNPLYYFIANTSVIILLAPFIFRWSRALYMNIFVSYDERFAKGSSSSDSLIQTPGA